MRFYDYFILVIFCLSLISLGYVLGYYSDYNMKETFVYYLEGNRSIIVVKEQLSPMDRVNPDDIHIASRTRFQQEQDGVFINIPNKTILFAGYINSNSMDPVLDEEATGIYIVVEDGYEIRPGDIISYNSTSTETSIVHRVIETGFDESGWYAIVKGDNVRYADPEKVRFEQIRGVVVGIIY